MKILLIAPLPPPIHGQSLVSKVLYDHASSDHNILEVNMSKKIGKEGVYGLSRLMEITNIIRRVRRLNKQADVIYLTISESLAGNIKDLLIYLVCFKKISKVYIHLHGGSIKKILWDKSKILYKINRLFIKRLGGVIISGESHKEIFNTIINENRIFTIPNFAPDEMFISKKEINRKYEQTNPLRIVYISGMREKKGYIDLLGAYLILEEKYQTKLQIDFAGNFESDFYKNEFLNKIKSYKNIKYHGVVNDKEKKDLFAQAHIFCLPTKYFEGQPVSILEAYASGCAVLTTGLGGIIDIFRHNVNGYNFEVSNIYSLRSCLLTCLKNIEQLRKIALFNHQLALHKYKSLNYSSTIIQILKSKSNL